MKENILERIPAATQITSRTNPQVVSLSKLDQAKHRRAQGLFLAEGVKLSAEAAGRAEVRYVLLRSDDGYADSDVLDIAAALPNPRAVIVLPPSVFEKITTESAPQGIITVLEYFQDAHRPWQSDFAESADGERLVAVDAVQDPGNLGTVLRTACAFGYRRVLLGNCADIYHPRTVRASMGALFRLQIDLCDDLAGALSALQHRGHRVLAAALAENAAILGEHSLQPDDCVVIGNEGHGVSRMVLNVADTCVKIPMAAGTESLNAAGAASVLMWEYYRSFH